MANASIDFIFPPFFLEEGWGHPKQNTEGGC